MGIYTVPNESCDASTIEIVRVPNVLFSYQYRAELDYRSIYKPINNGV